MASIVPSTDEKPGSAAVPKSAKHPDVRYLDIREDDDLDEDLLASWFTQGSNLPGEKL
jgi:hypothetical protein